jgi:hypothetical protein
MPEDARNKFSVLSPRPLHPVTVTVLVSSVQPRRPVRPNLPCIASHALSNFFHSLILPKHPPLPPRCPTEGKNFGCRPTASLPLGARRSPDSTGQCKLDKIYKIGECGSLPYPVRILRGRAAGNGDGRGKREAREGIQTIICTVYLTPPTPTPLPLCPGMKIASCAV